MDRTRWIHYSTVVNASYHARVRIRVACVFGVRACVRVRSRAIFNGSDQRGTLCSSKIQDGKSIDDHKKNQVIIRISFLHIHTLSEICYFYFCIFTLQFFTVDQQFQSYEAVYFMHKKHNKQFCCKNIPKNVFYFYL